MSRSPRMIDLTGHLRDLRGSLSPECRHFHPAPPLYICRRCDADTSRWPFRLLLAFLIVFSAILTAYLASWQ